MKGQAPNHSISDPVAGELIGPTIELVGLGCCALTASHRAQGRPERLFHLGWVGSERLVVAQTEHVRGDDERGPLSASDGLHIIESSEDVDVAMVERQPDLFGGLPARGCQKVGVTGIGPPAGEGHVTGPRISRVLSPANQEYVRVCGAARAQDRGYGCSCDAFIRLDVLWCAAPEEILELQDLLLRGHLISLSLWRPSVNQSDRAASIPTGSVVARQLDLDLEAGFGTILRADSAPVEADDLMGE